jgi:tetratricopeptide (TPR) repeat protein
MMFGENAIAAGLAARTLGMTGDLKWAGEMVKAEEHRKSQRFTMASLEVRAGSLRDPKATKPLARLLNRGGGGLAWGFFLAEHGLSEESAKIMRKSLRSGLDDPDIYARIGIAEIEAGRAGEGMAKLRFAVKMAPFDAVNVNNFAWFLLTCSDARQRRPAEALPLAKRAAQLRPRTGYILDTYAWALHRNGKPKEALERMEAALQWARRDNPGEIGALRSHRARIMTALGRRDEALKELAGVIASFPRDPEVAADAARAYCDLGLIHKAREQLERMIDLGYPNMLILKQDPELSRLRKGAAFKALLKRAEGALVKLRAEMGLEREAPAPEPKAEPHRKLERGAQ